ncbi:FK506-binding nuclear protein [Entomortierella parvispora]|uniref:FK506-binding protein n=1 Tax=Entomortierella parvispora TaxID=205924 RepID=A0A9P3HLX7_9FUNG|nr:FK506-binding nuclear protein [Entomortierella parvispora]
MILGFWGLTVFPERTYTQIVDNSFKLSMAALDEETTPGRTSIRVSVDKKTFILCSLIAGQIEQQNLDLVFTEGEEITFSVSGKNAVHLSGNYLPEDEGMEYSEDEDMYGNMDMDDSDDDDEEEEDDEDDADDLIVSRGARKLALEQFVGNEDEDEDSEEDPDFTGEDDEDEDDDLEDSDEDMEEAQNNGDEDDEEDEDEDEDEDDEEEEEEEPVPVKPVAAKPAKKEAEVKEVKKAEVKKEVKKEEPKKANIKTLPNGLIIEDVKVGEGARAKSGKKIGMRYIGRLTNGKVFDKNMSGKPFNFNLGRGEVIKGWDLGIQGMQLGGERKLTIPPALAYGAQGAPPDIPRNATLEFDVKLVTLK